MLIGREIGHIILRQKLNNELHFVLIGNKNHVEQRYENIK